jgi:EmrB/QacA subfamily drug resistance transporter
MMWRGFEKMNEKQTKWVIFALMGILFISSMDQTIISTGMTTIVKDLGHFELYSWVFTIFMLTSTAIVPVIGKLSDLYGRKRFYIFGLLMFLIGSLLCGFATSMPQFIIYRGIQGIGAGTLLPVTFTLLMVLYPQEKWGRMQAMFGVTFGLSALVGPLVGAFITEVFHWRWNFFINLPLGIVALFIILTHMKENKRSDKPKIDYMGAITIVLATVALILSMRLVETGYNWASWQVISLFSLFVVSAAAFILVELKAQEPMMPLNMFRNRVVSGTFLTVFVQGSTQILSILFIPIFLTEVYGTKVSDTGIILTVLMLSVMVGSIVGGRLISKMSYRLNLLSSLLLMGIGEIVWLLLPSDYNLWVMVPSLIALGVGMGTLFTSAQIAVVSNIDQRWIGVATSSISYFRSIGGIMASAIVGAFVNIQLSQHLSDELKSRGAALPPSSSVSQLIEQAKASEIKTMVPKLFEDSLHLGNWILLVGIAASILFVSTVGNARFQQSENEQFQEKRKAISH